MNGCHNLNVFCIWCVVLNVVSFDLRCPENLHRPYRVKIVCNTTLYDSYSCLLDEHTNTYKESCKEKPNFVRPGQRYVINGFRTNTDCSPTTYQPFKLWSQKYSNCIFSKSHCNEIGLIFYENTSTTEDNTCRCDHNDGYAFLVQPRNNCYCIPSEEDCTCFKKKCPVNAFLSSDYNCMSSLTSLQASSCKENIHARNYRKMDKHYNKSVENRGNEKEYSRRYHIVPDTTYPCSLVIITVIVIIGLTVCLIVRDMTSRMNKNEKGNEESYRTNESLENNKDNPIENLMLKEMNRQQIPFKTGSSANTIHIEWQNQQGHCDNYEGYTVKYRTKDSKDFFTVQRTFEEEIQMSNLKSATLYEIRIYEENIRGDNFLLFKTEVRTDESIPSKLKTFAHKIRDKPDVYLLHPIRVKTISEGVQVQEYFSDDQNLQEQYILLLGASGSGKSSLVNAIFNYVTDVSFEDDFRFTVMYGEKKKSITQAEKIICYKIHCQNGFKIGFNLNIIDVPGIQSGDNASTYRQLIDLFRYVWHINGICLVVPSFCRLTEDYRSIFNNILSIFGKDIVFVIPLITYDEGGEINALNTLKAANMPYLEHMCFRFDNSQLLNANENIEVWNRRQKTLNNMFGEPSVFMCFSVRLTLQVLQSRAILAQSFLQANNLLQQLEEDPERDTLQNVHGMHEKLKIKDDRRKLENELKENHDLILKHGNLLKELAYLN